MNIFSLREKDKARSILISSDPSKTYCARIVNIYDRKIRPNHPVTDNVTAQAIVAAMLDAYVMAYEDAYGQIKTYVEDNKNKKLAEDK
jgi:hypothetical protein